MSRLKILILILKKAFNINLSNALKKIHILVIFIFILKLYFRINKFTTKIAIIIAVISAKIAAHNVCLIFLTLTAPK